MSMPWTSFFKNGVPAQAPASLDQVESRRHTLLALGGARGVAGTSMTGTGRMARPLPAEGGKHIAALQERAFLLGYPGHSMPWPWLALHCRRSEGPAALDTEDLYCASLRHSPTFASVMAHLSGRDFVIA